MTDGGRDQTSTGGSKGTLRILGSVNVQQPSRVAAFGDGTGQETLEIAAPISGSADLTVAGTSAFGDHRGTVRLSAANPYTGNISVFRPTPVASTIASETNRLLQINHLDALKFASLGLYSTQENPLSFTPASNSSPIPPALLLPSASVPIARTPTTTALCPAAAASSRWGAGRKPSQP